MNTRRFTAAPLIAVVIAIEDLEHSEVDADGPNGAGFQHDSRAAIHRHPPVAHPPAAVHLQVRVNAGPPDSDEQVLPPTEHLIHHLPGEVDGGKSRHPDIAACQCLPGQVLPQRGRGVPDGVALRHRSSQPQPAGRSDKARLNQP